MADHGPPDRLVPDASADLEAIRGQLGEANWASRVAEARARAAIVRRVLAAVEAGAGLAAAARTHAPQVRAPTVTRWIERWRAEGVHGLIDRRAGNLGEAARDAGAQLSLGLALGPAAASAPAPRVRSGRGRPALLVKWSGSKAAVVDRLLAMAPPRYERYHEPFLGGGTVFFALRPGVAFLSDRNAELVNLFQVVRDAPEPLLAALAGHRNDRDHFHSVRGIHPDTLAPVERAARTLFLNRTGFNGIYRVNRKGIFNVPYGKQPGRSFYHPEAIWRAHRDLAGAELSCADFAACAERARPGDFVYLDPPYATDLRGQDPDSVRYQAGGFAEPEQRRVAELVELLDRRGCLVMASNADCELTRALYRGFRVDAMSVRRLVGGHAGRRGMAGEIVVRNYQGRGGGGLPGME